MREEKREKTQWQRIALHADLCLLRRSNAKTHHRLSLEMFPQLIRLFGSILRSKNSPELSKMGSTQDSYIIVGAGVFGTSTALHLKAAEPHAHITLIDRTPFPCPFAASHDLNKIVRADYGDKFYAKLALEAQQQWRENEIYRPYYHESGLLNVEDTGLGQKIIQNYKDLGVEFAARMITPEDAQNDFKSLFKDAKWDDVKEVFWNPRSGWAAASAALARGIETAVADGVSYEVADVAKLLINPGGSCYGVQTKSGQELKADRVLLCTGAHTAKILADSAPHNKDFQSGNRIVAAAVVTADVQLTPEQVEKFQHVPVFVSGMSHTLGKELQPYLMMYNVDK